ncbi:MAG: M28 family peptidase, partial [Paludibacter sp.]
MRKTIIALLAILLLTACNQVTKSAQTVDKIVNVPTFSSDSAYKFVQQQVDFGARVPNTKAQITCANYLSTTLKRFGAEVIEQKASLMAFDGTSLQSINIIGSINPKAETRVLLFSHWDSRPWADHDPNPANHKKPVMGANDGASGVGILLEMARQFHNQQPNIGVDIIFFDAEDYGATEEFRGENTEDSWCLGTQYWAKNPHIAGYHARFGILLDMVGGAQATFYREQISEY